MSALDHGWKPSGMKHPPSKAVAHEFHEADKREGKWEHASGGTIIEGLRRIMPSNRQFNDHDMHTLIGNVNGHATGGLAHIPHPGMPHLDVPHPSPLSSIANEHAPKIGSQMGFQHASARMPRVPIADTLRNIDAKVSGAKQKLPKLKVKKGGKARKRFDTGGDVRSSSPASPGVTGAIHDALAALRDYVIERPRREIQADKQKYEDSQIEPPQTRNSSDYAAGGAVDMPPEAIGAIKKALVHLNNRDAGTAAATLRASPQAMAHPDVAAAALGLRSHTGIPQATKALTDLANANQAAKIPAPFRRGGRVR